MRNASLTLALGGLVAACLGVLSDGHAGARISAGAIDSALDAPPLFTPVLVWKDCQRIAMCTGCRAVFKCRSCSYRRTCAGGICGWGDVCVWGPYLKVLPRGARIIQ